MKFFTPELFVQGNSLNPTLVDQSEAAWEEALDRYGIHFQSIADSLPESMRRFCDEQCLHDADVFAPALIDGPPKQVMIVAQQVNTLRPETLNTLITLRYDVVEDPTIEIPVVSELFSDRCPVWLYEEIDVVAPGVFSHEILYSDGRVLKILFHDFHYDTARLVLPEWTLQELLRKKPRGLVASSVA